MIVTTSKEEDSNARIIEMSDQTVSLVLEPSRIDLGFSPKSMGRFNYDKNDMFLFPRHRRMSLRPINWNVMIVTISDEALLAAASEKNSVPKVTCAKYLKDDRISGLMSAVNADRLAGFPSGRVFLDSIELALSVALLERQAAQRVGSQGTRWGLTPMRLRRVLELVQSNLQHDLSLQEMADVAGLSIWHFSQMFRKSTNTTPHQFLMRQRVERAKDMLQDPSAKISDVAFASGFKTQQHLAQVFRKAFGVSPTEYQRGRR
jgi:AraC family transcriptional regulator